MRTDRDARINRRIAVAQQTGAVRLDPFAHVLGQVDGTSSSKAIGVFLLVFQLELQLVLTDIGDEVIWAETRITSKLAQAQQIDDWREQSISRKLEIHTIALRSRMCW